MNKGLNKREKKMKILKELDEKIIVALSEWKEKNAEELMATEIEETDEVIAELERGLIETDDVLGVTGSKACIQR